MFKTDPIWIVNTRPASQEVILKPTYIIVTLFCEKFSFSRQIGTLNQHGFFSDEHVNWTLELALWFLILLQLK